MQEQVQTQQIYPTPVEPRPAEGVWSSIVLMVVVVLLPFLAYFVIVMNRYTAARPPRANLDLFLAPEPKLEPVLEKPKLLSTQHPVHLSSAVLLFSNLN